MTMKTQSQKKSMECSKSNSNIEISIANASLLKKNTRKSQISNLIQYLKSDYRKNRQKPSQKKEINNKAQRENK